MRRRCVLCGCKKFAIIINIEFAEILQSLYCRRFFELMITVFESFFFRCVLFLAGIRNLLCKKLSRPVHSRCPHRIHRPIVILLRVECTE